MIIIGCDPGQSFGVSVLRIQENPWEVELTPWQNEPNLAIAFIRDAIRVARINTPHDLCVLAVERFIITSRTGRRAGASQTAQLAGRTAELADEVPGVTLALQTVSDASRAFSNHLLRRIGLYTTGSQVGCRDANDVNSATRHCLLWLLRNRPDVIDKLTQGVPIV